MNASIYVFEDGQLRQGICSQVQTEIQGHLVKKHTKNWHGQFSWHSEWSCSNTLGKRINSEESYNEALDFCLDSHIVGVVCVDFVFQKDDSTMLPVSDEHITKVFGASFPGGITRQELVEYPGLLLAFAVAINAKADVDLYLCTSNGKARISAINAIREQNTDVVVESFGDSILDAGKKGTLANDLLPLVDKYINERTPETILQYVLWPEESLQWFKKGKNEPKSPGDVPHNFDDFQELYNTQESRIASPLGIYLRRITGFQMAGISVIADEHWFGGLATEVKQSIEALVEKWLTNETIYRTMELFVGHHSMLGNGSERPSLSALAFPLLAALGANQSCTNIASQQTAKFAWIDKEPTGGSRSFDNSDRDATKAIFIKSYLLFKELETCYEEALFETTGTFDYLVLQLNINPTVRSSKNGSPPPRHPLLTLTQFRADEQDSGTMRAYNAFQDACKPKVPSQDRALFSWFVPTEDASKTVLKIGVAKRG